MTKTDILISFVLRSSIWGAFLGIIVGFIFQIVFLGPIAFGIFGLIIGCISGVILGIVNGIVLTIVTYQFTNPQDNIQKYKNTLSSTSGISTLVGSMIIFFCGS